MSAINRFRGPRNLKKIKVIYIELNDLWFTSSAFTAEVKNGIFYALLPGLTIFVIGVAFVLIDTLGMLDPETQQMLNAVKNKGPNSPPFTSPYG